MVTAQATPTHSLSLEFVLRTAVNFFVFFLQIFVLALQLRIFPGVYSCVAGNILGETVSKAFLQINLANVPTNPNNILILLTIISLVLNTAVK